MSMKNPPQDRDAISRARFFLAKAVACPAEERGDCEAFMEAAIVFARAAMHRFQKEHQHHNGWQAWWDSLLGNPAVDFFRKERNLILKEAPPKLGQKLSMPFIGPGGKSQPAPVAQLACEFYYFEDPAMLATDTIATHLDALEALLMEAKQRFG